MAIFTLKLDYAEGITGRQMREISFTAESLSYSPSHYTMSARGVKSVMVSNE